MLLTLLAVKCYSHLYSFGATSNYGENPETPLIQGTDGNFFGTAYAGGVYGDATVF